MKRAVITVVGPAIAALLAMGIGLLLSPIPTKLGFYRWLATRNPDQVKDVGLSPAWNYGVEWGYTFDELYKADLGGQVALVTGGNSGIGFATSLALARLGASVTIACLYPDRCEKAAGRIRSDDMFRGKVTPMIVDTSSLKSVKAFAQNFLNENEKLDMLFLNAGMYTGIHAKTDTSFPLSEDGIELIFATNVLGHHLMYKLLEPALLNSTMARVVLTSSSESFNTFDYKVATDLETLNGVKLTLLNSGKTYGQSKLAQILWAKYLTVQLGPSSSIFVNAAHPGAVSTAIWDNIFAFSAFVRHMFKFFEKRMWTAEEGALTGLYLGVSTEELKERNIRGRYFHPQAVEVINPLSLDEDLQEKLWFFCDDLVKDFV